LAPPLKPAFDLSANFDYDEFQPVHELKFPEGQAMRRLLSAFALLMVSALPGAAL
jgi:hypothetical protein